MLSMERIESLGVLTPVLKINNRENNIKFYQEDLGFKVWNEENAFADLGSHSDKTIKLILEESPSMRTRRVKGPKKVNQLVIKVTNPKEIETLLARGASYHKLYQGEKGWAFEAISPEGDVFLLHSEEDSAHLVEVTGDVRFKAAQTAFSYLSQFTLEKLKINTPNVSLSQAFYDRIFQNHQQLEFIQADGVDLQIDNTETWDLSALELTLDLPISLTTIQADLALSGIRSFVDKRATFLTLKDPSGLDLVFRP